MIAGREFRSRPIFFGLGQGTVMIESKFKMKPVGIGLGLRRENSAALLKTLPQELDCLELAPENYFHTGGRLYREFRALAEHYPMVFHGISLSIGSLKPLNRQYLQDVKEFIAEFKPQWFSDHLCYSSVMGAQFHDLLPLPFTEEAIRHVVPRIQEAQDFLGMPLAIENVSCYALPGEPEMKEWEFVREVVERADCALLLDVNNIYVNSVNFGFDPKEYVAHMPLERVLHIHVAGHRKVDDFLLDTHGAPVVDPVWDILGQVASRVELPAVIIERDNNLPPLSEQIDEVRMARRVVETAQNPGRQAAGGSQ